MPVLDSIMDNSTIVFSSQNAYTSMRLYYAILALFVLFVLASLFLNGDSRPFEKLFMSLMAFLTSVVIAITSFSLAIVSFANGESTRQVLNHTVQQQYVIPTIIMQNTPMIEIISCILAVLCFINVINCILVLIDYSRMRGVEKSES